jgi:hypothetical protein
MKTRFNASLFIKGDGLDFDEISRKLGLTPTFIFRKGEAYERDQTFDFDGWCYFRKVIDARSLEDMDFWDAIRPHAGYLRDLKQRFDVSITIEIKTDTIGIGFSKRHCSKFEISHRCMELFTEIGIPSKLYVITEERTK